MHWRRYFPLNGQKPCSKLDLFRDIFNPLIRTLKCPLSAFLPRSHTPLSHPLDQGFPGGLTPQTVGILRAARAASGFGYIFAVALNAHCRQPNSFAASIRSGGSLNIRRSLYWISIKVPSR